MDSLIVEDLGKKYFVPSKRPPADASPSVNLGVARVRLPRLRLPGRSFHGRDLWALRHVSFAVPKSEILGIIGANGAGKSTLLKIIARVTRPSEGRVTGTGRVVSLLELGAGFNPDFSAQDNILMNAAMHGIPRREVLDRMEEIIQFAELEEFTDNPLRQFSSGMYLRLAFSVAISMEPEILLADEILAVGDASFQERCLQRVTEESERGLTVLFVSHDLSAISRLCHRILWLDKGEVVQIGEPEPVIAAYEESSLRARPKGRTSGELLGRHANILAEITSVRLLNSALEEIGAAPTADDVLLRIRVHVRKPGTILRGVVDVHAKGVFLFRSVQPDDVVACEVGAVDLMMRIPAHLLAETTYLVNVTVYTKLDEKDMKVVLDSALTFLAYRDLQAAPRSGVRSGVVAPRLDWTVHDHTHAGERTTVS